MSIFKKLLLALILLSSYALVAAEQTPAELPAKNLGNATCGNAFCHGAKRPWKISAVAQNEFATWSEKDAHHKAFQALTSDKGKSIAKKLGLQKPAHEEAKCLSCHTHFVPQSQQSRTYDIQDGVSCESCHGAAEAWLEVHVSGTGTHADNLDAGMYQLENPIKRAAICMSCHIGTQDKFVDHRMIGAGHPRLVFELDTYTAGEPAHFFPDNEYKKRKLIANSIQTWAIGQAMSVQYIMHGIQDKKRFKKSTSPELSYFDCNACHHPMSEKRWSPADETKRKPGIPRLNTSNLLMLEAITKQVDEPLSKKLKTLRLALHQATLLNDAETTVVAGKILESANLLVAKFSVYEFGLQDLIASIHNIINGDLQSQGYLDHLIAEQSTLAISTFIHGLENTKSVDPALMASIKNDMGNVYKSVDKNEPYTPEAYKAAIQALSSHLKSLRI